MKEKYREIIETAEIEAIVRKNQTLTEIEDIRRNTTQDKDKESHANETRAQSLFL